jgi:hypothetical protein
MCGKRRCANLEQCAMEKLGRNVLFIKCSGVQTSWTLSPSVFTFT